MNLRKAEAFWLLLQAWAMLHFHKLMILILPFKTIAARLGAIQEESPEDKVISPWTYEIELAIVRAKRVTLYNSKCYDQALTAAYLLRRKGLPFTLYFGLAKEEGGLKAHAWVRCGNRIISGRARMEEFTAVAWFSPYKRDTQNHIA